MTSPGSREERLARALRTVSGSNRALLRAGDEASLLHEICRVVVEQAGYRTAMVGRAEHDARRSITVVARVSREAAPPEPSDLTWSDTGEGRGTMGVAIRTGRPCVVNDVSVHEGLPPRWREAVRERGFGAVLSLPLVVDGEVFGALTIAAPEPDAFDAAECELLSEAAGDLAFGLGTLRMRQRERHALQEIRRLNRALHTRAAVNHALATASDEHRLLDEICRLAVEECGYRLAWVGFVEADARRTLRPVAHAGTEDGFLALPRHWAGSREAERVGARMEAGLPWVVRDVMDDPDYALREEARARGFASGLALPLRVEGRLVGAVHVLAAEPDAFDERETELLMSTARDLGFGLGALRARHRALAAEELVRRMAYEDAATGLPNRARLHDLLAETLATAKDDRRPLAVLRVGLERFRDINETLGGGEVDALVREVAARLRRAAGPAPLLGRVADGEFALVLPRCAAEQATQLAQKVVAALAEPVALDGLLLDARSSVGISLYPGHGSDADALLRRAGMALDRSRQSASGVAVFKGGLDQECAQRLALMGDLRAAIERDELVLFCQPKLRLSSRAVCGAEALVRWQHPRLGMVGPGDFIKLAESTGLITPLTWWVLEAALQHSYAWREQGVQQPLSVNLSARDLRDPHLVEHVAGALDTWGAQAGWIEFELTESALMEDPAHALETLAQLKQLDLQLTIDDFGIGYSSLSYLQRLPVDAIKIDQSFVVDMNTNEDSATIVRSTIELAHNLNLAVIAEGVEDQATVDRLAALGCDMAQGYCIGRPMPADEFRQWQAASTRH